MSAIEPPAKVSWGLVLLLGALSAFAPMSIDMYLPSLPAIGRALAATPEQTQATLSAFFAGMAIGQFLYGPASDRFGRRGPLLVGVALYMAASAACALAPTIEVLTAARFVQALGGCAGAVISRAVVRDRFNHGDTARVLSQLMLVMGLAPVLAPLLGGWVLAVASWRWIFGVLVAFGALVGLWIVLFLAESRSAETAALSRRETPLHAFAALLRNRRLVGFLLSGSLNGALLFTYIAASSDLIIGTYGFSPGRFGWVFGANAVGLIGASQLNRFLLRTLTPDQVLARSSLTAVFLAGLLLLAAWSQIGGAWSVLGLLFATLSSYGLISGNTMAGALSSDPQRAGSISALMGGASFAAGALASGVGAALHDGTARPMAAMMFACVVGSASALFLIARPAPAPGR
jgi:DHA1 family bicyclomycin/chloramphenicol resistance-like MFS transporter